MERFTPYDKLSKKKKRELDTQRRGSWSMNPVTRKPANPKAYDRRKVRQMEDPSDVLCLIPCLESAGRAAAYACSHETNMI